MINREMKPVYLVSFTSGTDKYGQKRNNGEEKDVIEMAVKIYSQTNVSDIRYNDIELIGLTKTAVKDSQQIEIDSVRYQISYVIPSGRYTQVLMKKV